MELVGPVKQTNLLLPTILSITDRTNGQNHIQPKFKYNYTDLPKTYCYHSGELVILEKIVLFTLYELLFVNNLSKDLHTCKNMPYMFKLF